MNENLRWLQVSLFMLALLCFALPFVDGAKSVPDGYGYFPLARGQLDNAQWAKTFTGFQLMADKDAEEPMIAGVACIAIGILLSFIPGQWLAPYSALAGIMALVSAYWGMEPWRACENLARTQVGSPVILFEYRSGFFLYSLLVITAVVISTRNSIRVGRF